MIRLKNILIIAYYYPPKGGAGVQRTSKFAKYLCKLGYNVSVLTTLEDDETDIIDESLREDVIQGIKVYKVKVADKVIKKLYTKIKKIFKNNQIDRVNSISANSESNKSKLSIKKTISNLIYIPDNKSYCIKFLLKEGKNIIENNNIDTVFTTSSPYSMHIVGYKLSKKYKKVKWIADFRDAWVTNPYFKFSGLKKLSNEILERKVIYAADKIISVSEPIIEDFKSRYKLYDKFHVITNGYDEDDFDEEEVSGNSNDKFVLLFSGTLYGEISPKNVLIAINNLIDKGSIDSNKFEIRFIGRILDEDYKKMIKQLNKHKVVEAYNYMPHKLIVREMLNASALLLILYNGRQASGVYSGKIFEYIRTGKPIVGLVPDGVAKELIKKTESGYTADPDNIEAIEKIILKLYNSHFYNIKAITPNWHNIKKYSRRELTEELIRIIND